ncbi:hypothetical protein M434DRAFT_382679 [Hypoxylon sp. CO27-5]|nr:hypothetical protein M434DRAFT_382679 [Hypoxylon sp. CO27-5]
MSSESPSTTSSGSPKVLPSGSPTNLSSSPTAIAHDSLSTASSTPLSAALPGTSGAMTPTVPPDTNNGEVKKMDCNQKDNLAEGFEATKKSELTNKNLKPELGTVGANKRKHVQNVGSDEGSGVAKKPKLDDKASQENDLSTDLQATKQSEPTVEELHHALKKAKEELEKMEGKLRRSENSLKVLEHKLLKDPHQYFPGANFFEEKFDRLSFRISQITLGYLVKEFEGSNLPEKIEKRLNEVSERSHKFLEKSGQADYLFQGLIWNFLCSEMFDNPFKLWGEGDEIGQAVAEIMCGPGNREHLDRWRSYTSQILYDRPMNDKKIQRIKDELSELINPFIIEEKNRVLKTNIELQINDAFELALVVARDIYRYETRFEIMRKNTSDSRYVSQAFDDSWMQIRGLNVDDHDVVDLLITPALVGRFSVWNSDKEQALVYRKAEVCYRNGPSFYKSDEYEQIKSLSRRTDYKDAHENDTDSDSDSDGPGLHGIEAVETYIKCAGNVRV